MDNKQKMIVAGAAFLLTGVVAFSAYMYNGKQAKVPTAPEEKKGDAVEEEKKQEESVQEQDPADWIGFEDPFYSTNHYLTKIEAQNRAKNISDVDYSLVMGLVKGGGSFHGKVTISYKQKKVSPEYVPDGDNSDCLFIDYKGKVIKSITVNGSKISANTPNVWVNHRIYIPVAMQKVNKNFVDIEFESTYVTDCQGFQHFRDDADGSEYIYTELEPDYCHIVFPCFDQPDLKAPHKTCIFAPEDWEVISNSEEIGNFDPVKIDSQDQEFKGVLRRWKLTPESQILTSFGDIKVKPHEFTRTKAISTYLFAFVAGPFDVHYPSAERSSEEPRIPMRFYCRKSLSKYAEGMKDDWFRINKASIRYYAKTFDKPYPFDKLDSIMCPDYAMGAMENVGCITYNDDYIPRDENFTRYKQENIFNTIAHEISHQWFGNLVTMKWWDDLWLNESFANTVSYMAMDEAEGMEDITLAWNIFVDEQYSGLALDQKNTSHPIAADCLDTGKAQDIFDGISYGKGAAFLHQMIFFLGKDFLKEGLKTYFQKYEFKNTELKDFIAELSVAAKKFGIKLDFEQWSDSWLTKAGCAEIELKFDRDEASGNISNLKMVQTPYNIQNTPENCLRVQALNVASVDENMQVIDVVRVETSATESETVIDAFNGPKDKKIHAFLINYDGHGYGKFGVSDLTLSALETGLHKIDSSLNRKQILNMLYDLVKSGKIPASRVLKIVINNLEHEHAVDVLQDTLRFIVPGILGKFIHNEVNEARNQQMFDLTMKIMKSGRFNDQPATMETLLSSAISFASNGQAHALVYKWFSSGSVCDAANNAIVGASINVKVRHTMVRKFFASSHIETEAKKESFKTLAKLDSSDMLGRTEKYCESANPDPTSKNEAFLTIFEGSSDMSLQHVQEMCRGYRQYSQRETIESFAEQFFERIEDCVNTKSWSLTRYIYLFLAPSMMATETELVRFRALQAKLESYSEAERKEGTPRLITWVKESIQEVEEKMAGREFSRAWEAQQPNL